MAYHHGSIPPTLNVFIRLGCHSGREVKGNLRKWTRY